jgi:hypothetical protein
MVEYKNRDRLDREVIGLVLALNSYVGIRTCESCSGHGDHPFWVEFLAHSPESLAEVLWWFRKSLGMSWRVFAKTDVDKRQVYYRLEAPGGDQTFEEADALATQILDRGGRHHEWMNHLWKQIKGDE